MEITEVRVKLTSNQSDRVRAFCSVTFDREFVVRDIKVIEGTSGLFVAMPSRKISDHCPKCRGKNHLRAKHCNECGCKLRDNRAPHDGSGRSKLHADIAHPINTACRERLQTAILEEYQAEQGRSQEPGYEPTELDASENRQNRSRPASEQPAEEPKEQPAEEPEEQVHDDFDNGAEYAALIAELRSERPQRAQRPVNAETKPAGAEASSQMESVEPDESAESAEPVEADEPDEADEPAEAGQETVPEPSTNSEFGRGIL